MTRLVQPPDTSQNTSFSKELPGLQLALDSTSLGVFKECPRKYYYSIILGFQPRITSVHLQFGIWMHKGREIYEHLRTQGQDHAGALHSVVKWALCATWNKELSRPWLSDIPEKTRQTLVRTLVWYLEEFGEGDNLQTVQLPSGKPAVELSFRFAVGKARTGEDIFLCGHLDRVATLSEDYYICDLKTTKSQLRLEYFQNYSPDNQMSLYALAGQVVWQLPIKGIIVDAIQIGATFSRHQRGLVPRTSSQLEEWLEDFHHYYEKMQDCAEQVRWPMNDKACGNYGGCTFRQVCGRSPAARDQWLRLNYSQRIWDPLQVRGDI